MERAKARVGQTGPKLSGADQEKVVKAGKSTARVKRGAKKTEKKPKEKTAEYQVMTDKAIIEDNKGVNKTRAIGDRVTLTETRANELRQGGIALAAVE